MVRESFIFVAFWVFYVRTAISWYKFCVEILFVTPQLLAKVAITQDLCFVCAIFKKKIMGGGERGVTQCFFLSSSSMRLLFHFIYTQFILHRHNIWNLFPALYKKYIYTVYQSIFTTAHLMYSCCICTLMFISLGSELFFSFLFLIEDAPRKKNTVKTVIL